MSPPSPRASLPAGRPPAATSTRDDAPSHSLFAGLTVGRFVSVSAIGLGVASSLVWVLHNSFLDLLVSTLCVAYTTMVAFTMAGNLPFVRSGRVAREAAQLVAVVAGSMLGTVVVTIVKGRRFETMFTESLSGIITTTGLGIGFGSVVVAFYFYRERNARTAAELARVEAEFDAARAREEKQLLSARLQLLQAQVEPHFLFNTLANVQHLTTTDPPRATVMLESLIRYLRAALPQMREQASTVAREVAMVEAYLEIQRVRMGDRLAFAIDVGAEVGARAMPPMMLISLVENAVEHGIDPLAGGGRIAVSAATDGERVRIVVRDDGAGLSEHAGLGIGLTNIRERLATLFGADGRLELTENRPRGLVATLEWPVVAP